MVIAELHVGMPKAGSSTIQTWLSSPQTQSFLAAHGTTVCVARTDDDGRITVEPYRAGPVNSGGVVTSYFRSAPERRRDIVAGFVGEVEEAARRFGRIVLSSEAFTQPLWRADSEFLAAIGRLSEEIDLRLAYYVRPQHTALEAAWRQWGFRTGLPPAEYIERRSAQMHYAETCAHIAENASGATLIVRPFRTDLLADGDVVGDYARRVLGLPAPPPEAGGDHQLWENRGLPLDVVNLLATMPTGSLWSNPHDNRGLDRLRHMLGHCVIPDSERVSESRRVLQAHTYRIFETENRRLIADLGWPTDHFIPAPDPDTIADIGRLDELWAPAASEAEQAFLRAVLERLLER